MNAHRAVQRLGFLSCIIYVAACVVYNFASAFRNHSVDAAWLNFVAALMFVAESLIDGILLCVFIPTSSCMTRLESLGAVCFLTASCMVLIESLQDPTLVGVDFAKTMDNFGGGADALNNDSNYLYVVDAVLECWAASLACPRTPVVDSAFSPTLSSSTIWRLWSVGLFLIAAVLDLWMTDYRGTVIGDCIWTISAICCLLAQLRELPEASVRYGQSQILGSHVCGSHIDEPIVLS